MFTRARLKTGPYLCLVRKAPRKANVGGRCQVAYRVATRRAAGIFAPLPVSTARHEQDSAPAGAGFG